MTELKTITRLLKTAVMRRFLCWLGFHKNYKWQPYPNIYPEIKVNRCKCCDYFEWR